MNKENISNIRWQNMDQFYESRNISLIQFMGIHHSIYEYPNTSSTGIAYPQGDLSC